MNMFSKEQFSTSQIGHLGLVADKIDAIGLIDLIDERLPVSKEHGSKVSQGERVAAMILNGLGFIDNRLYLFPEFLRDKPITRLFQKALKAEWFNDDALGRCLDAIADYGCTKLFTELSLLIGKKRNLLGKSMHLDTTTLSLFGTYDDSRSAVKPERGYAKSGRHDLKQMILLLATTGASHFPLWMEAHSGNVSDKKSLPSAAIKLRDLCASLESSEAFIYVGDSAIYSAILSYSDSMRWISRVPETIKQAKRWISQHNDELTWVDGSAGYRWSELETTYRGVKQRWVMFFSQEAYEREIKTLRKRIESEAQAQEKAWWHLSNQIFSCESDALKAIEKHKQSLVYQMAETSVIEVRKHQRRGRPKVGEEAPVVGYQVIYKLQPNKTAIAKREASKGRFILATNILDKNLLSNDALLEEYKAQSGVEKSFKFLKNNTFEVDSVFLKTPKRIEALMMIMSLCLMVYGISEYELHQSLAEKEETIPNQLKKPTSRPSLRWVYYLFRVVNELQVRVNGTIKKFVINVDEVLSKVVRHFGVRAQCIYLNSS